MDIQSRLPDVGTSIFTIMSKMAAEHNAINLSQGFPDFPVDQDLIALINRFMVEGHNQYAPMAGVPALREIIAHVVKKTYQQVTDPESEITITAGATEGLFAAIAAFIHPGDEVIIFDPSYDSYEPAIRLNGGVAVPIGLRFPYYAIDWDLVEQTITPRTRMILINNPHNPAGVVLTEDDLTNLERIALAHNLIVLSDEVYDRLTYDGVAHQSVLTRPGLASQSLAVFSFGKTFHATGWKAGYVVAPEPLTLELRKAHQFIVFSVNGAVQHALAEYMKVPVRYLELNSFFQKKRDFFLEQMKGSSFEPLPCQGSYFQLMSYANLSKMPDVQMAEELTRKFGVATVPVSVFYRNRTDNRVLRFCFAKKEETLAAAADILRKL